MIDSRQKRMSAIGVCVPSPSLLPDATSAILYQQRRALVWMYIVGVVSTMKYVCRIQPEARSKQIEQEVRVCTVGTENRICITEI